MNYLSHFRRASRLFLNHCLFGLTFFVILVSHSVGLWSIVPVATAQDLAIHHPLHLSPDPITLQQLKRSDLQLSQLLSNQIAQANGYQRQGLYRRSRKQLESLAQTLTEAPDSVLKVKGLLQLANILSLTGDDYTSIATLLQQALTIAHRLAAQLDDPKTIGLTALAHFHQGNFHLFHNQPAEAQLQYDQALNDHPNITLKLMIQVRSLGLKFTNSKEDKASLIHQWNQSLQAIQALPDSSSALYLRIELAELDTGDLIASNLKQRLLIEALQLANSLNDRQASTEIFSDLGRIHLASNRLDLADRNAHQALQIAQRINNSNLIYQNFHLLGQIEVRRQHFEVAKQYYQSAIDILQQIRYDLVATSPYLQFEFRKEVEPIYRELVDLLLTSGDQSPIPPQQLKQAQTVMDSLRDAELINYFREACWDVVPQAIEKLDPKAAVIYPIVLADRLEVLWNIPGQALQHHTIPVSQTTIETRVGQMRQALRSTSLASERKPIAQELYNWLIRPALPQLQAHPEITTLVFNPDTAFQLLPMNTLYDGQHYLIEHYAIATTPGLKIRPGEELRQLSWKGSNSFVAGISAAQGDVSALPGVLSEVNAIARQVNSSPYQDDRLTLSALQTALAKTPIVLLHLATHGQFSATPDGTFLQLWGDRLTVKELGLLFEERTANNLPPLQLLVLSACQTAQGDPRAALGIAGIAVQSGARSTIASLWTVDDQSTAQLMRYLYQNLDQAMGRAEALRQAQLQLLKDPEYSHPYYWSAFTLIGAWW